MKALTAELNMKLAQNHEAQGQNDNLQRELRDLNGRCGGCDHVK